LETCLDGSAVAKKAYAAKWESVAAGKVNSESTQDLHAGRQDAFTTGFVDRGPRGIDDCDVESLDAGRNCGSQSGGPTTDDQDVGRQLYHLNKTNSEQKPGPMAASKP
jgi:hypothetical protein